jgi:hypothetical protein
MRRRPDDRPTDLPRAYARQAVLIAAFHDVVVATRCRTRLLDLALPVTHLTSGRAVHERLPQLRPVRDKWVHRSGVHRSGGPSRGRGGLGRATFAHQASQARAAAEFGRGRKRT